MTEWRVLYKCRRCGEVDSSTGGNECNVLDAISEAMMNGKCSTYGIPVTMVCFHHCKDKGSGVADLIGAAPNKS